MKAKFSDFEAECPIYRKYFSSHVARYIFEEVLSRDDTIIAMIDYSNAGKPALAACVLEIERHCLMHSTDVFSLDKNSAKQALGRMVKVVLNPFGYLPSKLKRIARPHDPANKVVSAHTYAKTGPAKLHVVRRIEPV